MPAFEFGEKVSVASDDGAAVPGTGSPAHEGLDLGVAVACKRMPVSSARRDPALLFHAFHLGISEKKKRRWQHDALSNAPSIGNET